MIRAIIFDCFGVLYRSSADELYEMCQPDDRPHLHDIRLQRDRGYIHYEEYLDSVAKLVGKPASEIQHITESSHIRNEELFSYIREIDRTKYRVGVLSNIGDTIINQLFTEQELDELFDATVLSYQVGMVKPDPAIYRLMAERLDATEDECVMIDDGEMNCEGAEHVGMSSVHYTNNAETLAKLEEILSA